MTMRRPPSLPCLYLGSFGLLCQLVVGLVLLRPSSSWPLHSSDRQRREFRATPCAAPNHGIVHFQHVVRVRHPAFLGRSQQQKQQLCRNAADLNRNRRSKLLVMHMASSGTDSEELQDDNDGRILFDDFGDRVIGGGDLLGDNDASVGGRSSSGGASSTSALLSSQLRTAVEQQESRRRENWQKGNWQVRGISLDPDSATDPDEVQESNDKIHVCRVAADVTSPSRIWVGRTDGSLLAVQLGDDYITKFRSQLSATFNDSTGTVQISSKLVNDNDDSNFPSQGDDDEDDSEGIRRGPDGSTGSPFELQYQGSVGSSPVSCVLVASDETLYSTCRDSGDIQQWVVEELEEDDRLQLLRRATLSGAHGSGSTILLLKTVRLDKGTGLVSVARDGTVGLWDTGSGTLQRRFQIEADNDPDQQAEFVRAADCDGTNLFVGTARGQVLAYALRDVLDSTQGTTSPPPSGQWTASVDHAVTAIACGGPGSLGSGGTSTQPTSTLFTGDGGGTVKQWEVLTRSSGPMDDADRTKTSKTRLEPWPRLPTQRLQKRAHVFQSLHTDAVTALLPVDSHKVLSASCDGSVVAWNPVKGKSYFFMDGFEPDIRSLCVQENTLVTDGMRHLVCVHDFNVEADIPDDDDWDRFDVDR